MSGGALRHQDTGGASRLQSCLFVYFVYVALGGEEALDTSLKTSWEETHTLPWGGVRGQTLRTDGAFEELLWVKVPNTFELFPGLVFSHQHSDVHVKDDL